MDEFLCCDPRDHQVKCKERFLYSRDSDNALHMKMFYALT